MFSLAVDDDLSLELAEEHHARETFDLVHANREHLRPWMPWVEATRTVDDMVAFLRFVRGEYVAGRQFHGNLRYRGALAGCMGLRLDRPHDACDLGYWLGSAYTGRGIVTRAARALTSAAFRDLAMHRVSIRAGEGNARSRAVAERLGFTFEGVLRENEKVGESYVSLTTYSMLAGEWQV
jgi:ribosomal-protein-serine acetyltransferase